MPDVLTLAVRPDDWDLALFVHVAGAMILVGGLLTCVVAMALARGDARLMRTSALSLFAIALPGWLIMRAAAEWIYDKEGWGNGGGDDPTWLGIGFIVADAGGVLLIAALVCAGIGMRRLNRDGGGNGLIRAAAILAGVALLGDLVAVWAMGGKPT